MGKQGSARPRIVDATILFIDLMGSVSLSNSMSLFEYNELINEYQGVLSGVLDVISARYPVAEYYLGGDQLAVFFYDPQDALKLEKVAELRRRHKASPKAARLEQELQRQTTRCLYGALRCAVQVKNAWVSHPRNVARINSQQPILEIGAGINTGPVVLQDRGEGRQRIEGFAINFAKRVEGFSRHGNHCKIFLSKTAYETFNNTTVAYLMLKQRAAFEPYVPQAGLLKGLVQGTKVFELKFFHRLEGFSIPPENVPVYTQVFEDDPTNIWAYTNLINYHLYENEEYDIALEIAQQALYSNPGNEKICFDLAKLNFFREEYFASREYALQGIRLNPELDIAHDLLADIEYKLGNLEQAMRHRATALAISPGSAQNHIDMAMALARLGHRSEASRHYRRSKQLYPGIANLDPEYVRELEELIRSEK